MKNSVIWVTVLFAALICGCASKKIIRQMDTTGYCGCKNCCGWERGSWTYLKLDFWNKYVSYGKRKGQLYSGKTSSGTEPQMPRPGLFSVDSLVHPWMIPIRMVFFPWLLMPRSGTIAADTKYYPFGTRMYVPGYGRGVVEDRGSAIKGVDRLDLYFKSHGKALAWGRRKVKVRIEQ